ncbi:hypothetical protein ACIGXM_04150 [Kitasatospora sp. NPDC052896]|uniref:hypothetical protein n=1 Tax=Kitasatospora sp. NPDC052896 TaxID=3364061 RepID=UPI0037C767E3
MISKAVYGKRTIGALAYLYGPGKANEHTDPHIVASWDGFAPDPGRDPNAILTQLRDALDLHVVRYGRPIAKHVYHRPVRADPTDRILSDEEWGAIARRIVAAAGIAPDGDPDGCRWIAVRHAGDHIHILATTVRADLTQARLRQDQYRVEGELTKIEREYGLVDLSETRTHEYRQAMPKRATGPELRKTQRLGREEPARETLRTAVRRALAGAASEQEFLTRLTDQGIRFGVRRAPSGDVTGYKFALPGDRSSTGGPVWFSGSKLTSDLTQPQIKKRLAVGTDEPRYPDLDRRTWPAAGRHQASTTVDQAMPFFADELDAADAAAVINGGIEILDALTTTSPVLSRKEINQAARALERTGIANTRAAQADLRAMRSAARAILHGGPAIGRGEDGTAAATLLSSLVLLAVLIAKWQTAQGRQHQATAAHTAADHLRTAYNRHAAKPLAVLDTHGQHLDPPARDRQAAAVRRALPADQAAKVLEETGWNALAVTLAEAEAAGHDPATLLTQAAGRRELATADSATAVLTWRIRRDAGLPATTAVAKGNSNTHASMALSRSTVAGRTAAPTANPAVTPQPPSPATPQPTRARR